MQSYASLFAPAEWPLKADSLIKELLPISHSHDFNYDGQKVFTSCMSRYVRSPLIFTLDFWLCHFQRQEVLSIDPCDGILAHLQLMCRMRLGVYIIHLCQAHCCEEVSWFYEGVLPLSGSLKNSHLVAIYNMSDAYLPQHQIAILKNSTDTLWPEIETSLKIFQTMACLEILHSLLGFVKSPWFTTFMQGFITKSRILIALEFRLSQLHQLLVNPLLPFSVLPCMDSVGCDECSSSRTDIYFSDLCMYKLGISWGPTISVLRFQFSRFRALPYFLVEIQVNRWWKSSSLHHITLFLHPISSFWNKTLLEVFCRSLFCQVLLLNFPRSQPTFFNLFYVFGSPTMIAQL